MTMLAVRVHHFGGPEELSLEQVQVPEPQLGEALVRLRAAGVGPWDALIRTGRSGVEQALPLTPGSDIAGIVERVRAGDEPASVSVGDAVYGVTNDSFTGGYAQYAVASLGSLARKPERLDFVGAASVPVVAVIAWQMLFDRAAVSAGQTVLVLGASGNVGSYAVQLATWAGVRVIGISHADDARRFDDLAGSVDAVIDTVGHETQAASFVTLKKGGILVSSVSAPSQQLALRYGVRTAYFVVHVPTAQLERIAQLLDAGELKTNVGVVLDLSEAREAHEMLDGTVPHPSGKVVLKIP
jgi:NADPH:quinone reductase-like Zn-dependent oxidoreductase